MKLRSLLIPTLVAPLIVAGGVGAQVAVGDPDPQPSRLFLAAKVGAAFPLSEFRDVVGTGVSWNARAGYRLAGPVGVYVGYGRTAFPVEDGGGGGDLVVQGPEVGLELRARQAAVTPWLRASVFIPRVAFSDGGTDATDEPGFSATAGAEMSLGSGFLLAASVDWDWCGTKIPIPIPIRIPGPRPNPSWVTPGVELAFRR